MISENDPFQKKLDDYENQRKASYEISLRLLATAMPQAMRNIIALADDEDKKIRLDASKHVLRLGGLEIDRQQITGKLEFEPLIISRETNEKN